MKKLTPLALCVLMAPGTTLMLGAGAAHAQTTTAAADTPALTTDTKVTTTEMKTPSAPMGATITTTTTVLASRPSDGFSADELLGKDVNHRGGDKSIGEINDLIIDKDGQIVAVIVEVGGFLGIGEKNVAINWNTLARTANKSGTGYDLSVDSTEKALMDAPVYKRN